jgi:hypothetical protein
MSAQPRRAARRADFNRDFSFRFMVIASKRCYPTPKGQIFVVLQLPQNLSAELFSGRIGRRIMRKMQQGDWLTQAFGLGPFTFGNRLERKLRKEISVVEFSRELREQLDLAGLKYLMPPRTASWLYEIALRARVEKETVILAQRNMRTRKWRESEKKTDELIALLDDYSAFDPERALRKAFGSRRDSRTSHRAARLLSNLRSLKYQFKWWSGFARWGSWPASYKGYLIAMENHLRKRFPNSLQIERGELIEFAVRTSGLNPKASAESILRALRRVVRKRMTNAS